MDEVRPAELDEKQQLAVNRFENYHANGSCGIPGSHRLIWHTGPNKDLSLECACGSTLHLADPIYVSVEPGYCGSHSVADSGIEAVFQSAMATLPEEAIAEIRSAPSVTNMHFGLGLYLRNEFIHSGLLYCGIDPDNQSSAALEKLVRYCIPELAGYGLIFDRIGHGVLQQAWRYCAEIRGHVPIAELKLHYDLLLEAQEIKQAISCPFDDRMRAPEWREPLRKLEQEYELASLREIWRFEELSQDLGEDMAGKLESICLDAARSKDPTFVPSEIGYLMTGRSDEAALRAFVWSLKNINVKHLPPELFARRDLALILARLPEPPSDFPDPSLSDDDEIGAALAQSGDNFNLHGMSRRIKEKYMTSDELECWGDDPWWWNADEDDDDGEDWP